MTALIHPTALVAAGAELDTDVRVGPYTVIGSHVRIGARTEVGAHCVLDGHTTIGPDNRIASHNVLGCPPQDVKYAGEPCELVIGARNQIREFCTFSIGSATGRGRTELGDDNFIMAYVHLAHDCVVGSHTIFANNSQLAGHVSVGDWCVLGGFTVVRQFLRIGPHAMTAMSSLLFADVPPFVMTQGQPADARGVNSVGLKRRGFSERRVAAVKAMHRLLYRDGLTLQDAMLQLPQVAATYPEAQADVQLMQTFLQGVDARRGIVR